MKTKIYPQGNTPSHSGYDAITMSTETDLPRKLAAPARRALLGAGYTRLEQFAELAEADVMTLHGMGPKAMDVLRDALKEHGLSFRG